MKEPRHVLAAAMAKRTLTKTTPKHLSSEIAAYLLDTHRTGELDSIVRDIVQYRADKGIVEVIAVSAFDLSDQVRKDIETQVRAQYPDATHIIISHRLDANVVGGVKLEFANQQLDLSIRNKLNQLKQLTQQSGKER